MWINLGNTSCCVSRVTREERAWLWDYLSFEDTSTAYARRKGLMGGWDGKIRLYHRATDTFPAGLLGLVRKGAAKAGFRVEFADSRVAPCLVDPTANLSWLDPAREQPQALAAAIAATRGIIWAPTGSGKTEIIAGLTLSLPCRWLVLVTAKDLLEQAAERFERRARMAGVPERAGRCGDGKWEPGRVTVATVQTLFRRMKHPGKFGGSELLSAAQGVIADEAHQVPGKTFTAIMRSCENAYYRFGFSGTPLARGDKRNVLLVAAVGDVCYRIKAGDLIERGVLSRPRIKFLPFEHGPLSADNWQDAYEAGVVSNARRNSLIMGLVKSATKPLLLSVKIIEHGQQLRRMCERAGMKVDFVWGNKDTSERARAITSLRRGDTDVLVASTIFDVGVDIPELASIVNAAGGKSAIKTLQRLGRGMRISEGKTELEMYDIDDRKQRWLSQHSHARKAVYQAEGFEVVVSNEADAALALSRGQEPIPR